MDVYTLLGEMQQRYPSARPCPVCTTTRWSAASRGRVTCEAGHTFTLDPSMLDIVRIDHLPDAEAEQIVELAALNVAGLEFPDL